MVPVGNFSVFRGEFWKPRRHFLFLLLKSATVLSLCIWATATGMILGTECLSSVQSCCLGGSKWYYAKCHGAVEIGNSFPIQTPSRKRLLPATGGFKPSQIECACRLGQRGKRGQPPGMEDVESVPNTQISGLCHRAGWLLKRSTA